MDENHKNKISMALKGKRNSPQTEFSKNHKKGMTGRVHSLETREKMSKIKLSKSVGRKTPLKKRIFLSSKYKIWRSQVLERDAHTCTICGIRNVKIEVDHHPLMFAELLRDNNIDSFEKAMDCEVLWLLSCGRSLCKKCHELHGKRSFKRVINFGNNNMRKE